MTAAGLRVAIIGAGTIGRGFATVFAAAGADVRLHDPVGAASASALEEIGGTIDDLAAHGLVDDTREAILARIIVADGLEDAVDRADLVQECAPEHEELKRDLFAALDRVSPPSAILASASSAMPISRITGGLAGAARCIVAHPGNPPFLLRLVELVPSPATAPDVVERVAAIYSRAGLAPVTLGREIEGFVFNRLQGAVLREAYCLVRDGVASVADIDRVMRDGLGLRWSVVGPFETVDLNTRGGIAEHAKRLGPAYARMGAERGQDDPWTPDLVARVTGERRAAMPIEAWDARGRWRDRMMMAMLAARTRAGAGKP